jgi:hypothetical protein
VASGTDAAPEHAPALLPECHAKIVKIPKNGPHRAEERDAENHVPLVQRDGVVVHNDDLVDDADADVAGEAAAGDAVTVGDDDTCAQTWGELEANAAGDITADEVMSRARVE